MALRHIIKSIVNDYTETKRKLLKEEIIAINTEEALNLGKAIEINEKLIHESFARTVYIKENN